MRLLAFPLLVITGVSAPLAAQSPPPSVTRLGTRDLYGPGIVTASSYQLQFELARPAHVIVLRVDPDGSIQPVFPAPEDQQTEKPSGRHALEALPAAPAERTTEATGSLDPVLRTAQGVARQGTQVRPSAVGDEPVSIKPKAYWLLIVSDVATSADDLQSRLETMQRDFPSITAELEGLARELTKRRTRKWTAYYTPVSP
jgi:hypothetical protein